MIGAVLGGLSAVASGISAIKNFQQAKQAQKTANMFGQQLQGIKETNALKALRAPDISGLQAQQAAATSAQFTQAIQGSAENASQAGNLYQATLQQNAENMQRQGEANYQADLAKMSNEQDVQYRNTAAERALVGSRLEGAQQAAADRYNAGIAGVTGAISGLGNAAAGLATSSQFDYGLDAFKRQQLAKKGYNSEEIDQLIAAGLKG